jgi:predicted glycoside hydrolase/deacetylase ChbG (UPF0249 family)
MKKSIVLCADDYGQAPAISQGVIDLLKNGRLSAVSCMVTTAYWPLHAKWLLPYQSQVDIGLHLNFTDALSLPHLMVKAVFRRLSLKAVLAEIHAQLDAFEAAIGTLPDFIDGHQHVHQFPVIRDALMQAYDERLKMKKPYIRVINGSLNSFKKWIIYALGTQSLTREIDKRKIARNQSFSGIYSFNKASHYDLLFPAFLAETGADGLIMCHPGLPSSDPNDSIAISRYFEFQYLSGMKFKMDCEEAGVMISRMTFQNNLLK